MFLFLTVKKSAFTLLSLTSSCCAFHTDKALHRKIYSKCVWRSQNAHREVLSETRELYQKGCIRRQKTLKNFWHWRCSYDRYSVHSLIDTTCMISPVQFFIWICITLFDSDQMECGQQVRHGRRRYGHNPHNHPRQSQRNGYGTSHRYSH